MKYCIFVILLTSFVLGGCRWRDDFRERSQPQLLEPIPEPTLNKDSPEYVGNRRNALPQQAEQDPTEETTHTSLPAIDNLSKIPALPEHPAGIETRYN